MGKDKFGTKRGRCGICEECYEYIPPASGETLACEYCDHKPIYHTEIVQLRTCSCGKCHGYTNNNEYQYTSCDYCDCAADKHIGYEKVQFELEKAKQRLKPPVAPVVRPPEPIPTPQAQLGPSGQSEPQYGLMTQPGPPMGMTPPSMNPQLPMIGQLGGIPNQGIPNQGMSNQGIPNQGMSNQGMPNQGMPNQGMSNQGMPNQGMPNQGMSTMQGYAEPQYQVPSHMQSQMPPQQFSMPYGAMQGQFPPGYGQSPTIPNQQFQTQPQFQQPGAMPHGMSQPNVSMQPGYMSWIPPLGQHNMGGSGSGGSGNRGTSGDSGGGICIRPGCNKPKRKQDDGIGYYDYCGRFCSNQK